MKNTLLRVTLAASLCLTASAGLAACNSDSGSNSSDAVAVSTEDEDAGTKADLELARQTILDTLDENGYLPQIYLAPDVTEPESKYGMLVVPYVHSDATEKLTSSIVDIDEGNKFEISALSAESGTEWVINQDGEFSTK